MSYSARKTIIEQGAEHLILHVKLLFRFYADDGKSMLIDIDNQEKEDIVDHLVKVVGKSKDVLKQENIRLEKKENPANFGVGCPRSCLCVVPGQIPCPGVVPLPFHMRGKMKNADN